MPICTAIRERRLLTFDYDGHHRVVQPAAHGNHVSTGNPALRAYQVSGTGSTRTVPFWDMFRLDKMRNIKVLEERFPENPPDYRPGDKHLDVHCEL